MRSDLCTSLTVVSTPARVKIVSEKQLLKPEVKVSLTPYESPVPPPSSLSRLGSKGERQREGSTAGSNPEDRGGRGPPPEQQSPLAIR